VWVFHPENIEIGNNVYVGHGTFLKGYYKSLMVIGDNTWIGQTCFLHAGGGLRIGNNVGIGPCVKILTHQHREQERDRPIVFCEQEFRPVVVEDDGDIGIGAIILPGVTIGRGAIVGAGAVVTHDVEPYTVVVGVPARVLRVR
jgi:acetyltransferase-like isoleucine patch superfamily enzyme